LTWRRPRTASGQPAVGDLRPADPLAALINASASHAHEFDDSYRAGLYHPARRCRCGVLRGLPGGASGADLTGIVAG
jgi:hypothetical protein